MLGPLVLLGTSHRTAPVEERERLAIRDGHEAQAVHSLLGLPAVSEAVVVSTCNRVEIIATGPDPRAVQREVLGFLRTTSDVNDAWLQRFIYEKQGGDAIAHLFRVASSLDSLVLGEPQILGQVKRAYEASRAAGGTGPILHRVFHNAFRVAKRVRTETEIADHAISVSYAAVELAKKVFGSLDGRSVLVIGAGKMGSLAARHLQAAGARDVHLVNRTLERARVTAAAIGAIPHAMDDLDGLLGDVDIVVSCTGASHYVLRFETVKGALARRRFKPLFLIDIAVPRDIDPRCESLSNTYLFDVDDLERVVESNRKLREREAARAEEIVRFETDAVVRSFSEAEAVPTIVALRRKLVDVKDRELERFLRAHGDLSPETAAEVSRFAHLLINKVLHEPSTALKRDAGAEKNAALIAATRALFALEDAVDLPDDDEENE
jgi:glutamyl-tRNA reductase